MVFASRLSVVRVFLFLLVMLLLASCATEIKEKKAPDKSSIALESRSSLLNWYDVTHKSYYGLKGAVKRVVVEPAKLERNSGQSVNDGWIYQFDRNGRLTSKVMLDSEPSLMTTYSYSNNGELKEVSSFKDGKLWRTSSFIYQGNKLVKIQFADKSNKEQMEVKVRKQEVSDGWFEIQHSISTPGLPVYTKFLSDQSLVWSNKGDINNGLGELYYIRTVDGVTSSNVVNKGTVKMLGVGGYRYNYRDDGLLESVESYNAHKNRLFHKTRYQYNDLALLVSEEKQVVDDSPFNQAVNETVSYEYLELDQNGNWVQRKLNAKTGFQSQAFIETRKIDYY